MDPIRYTVSFAAPHTHYAHVRAEVPTSGRDTVELSMAVWTPGSYLVREYSRHVEGVAAEGPDGSRLPVEKSAKNRWRITTGGAPVVLVTYLIYGRETSVRTNWIESGFAFLNGAPTFLTLAGDSARPHEVTIVPAPGWMRSVTSLDAGPRDHVYCARDYDTLVDSPILVGNPAVHEFTVDGTPHLLVNEGDTAFFDTDRAVKDLEAIVRAHKHFWRALPYERYVFFNLITEAGGGLEHARSSVLMTNRWATRTRKAYLKWLALASHELFHVWNVKRLRPIELGPFDYEREAHTSSLWMVEGITDYYGDVLVHRAGPSSPQEFLDALSDKIEELQTTPGRAVRDYSDALDVFGLRFKPVATTPLDRPKAWLGAMTRIDSGRLLVSQVRRHTPAFSAGLNVDDEIIAIDGVRVRADRLDERLEQYAPGNRVAVLVARRDRLLSLDVTLAAEPAKSWRLEAADQTQQAANRQP